MINDFLCERTGCRIYDCEVKKLNGTTGIEKQKEIYNDLFLVYPLGVSEQSNDIKSNGRSENIKYKMLISQEQRKKIKVGMKVAFNSTLFMAQTPYNNDLKPFDYNIDLKDIYELVIHQIDPIYDGCVHEYVCSLISFN